jgi:hypothetical protein
VWNEKAGRARGETGRTGMKIGDNIRFSTLKHAAKWEFDYCPYCGRKIELPNASAEARRERTP